MAKDLTEYGLTEKQRALVAALAKNGDMEAAAAKSGYNVTAAYTAARLPHVQAALHAEVQTALRRAAPIALKVLLGIISDDKVSPRVRVDAAKTVLDRAGHQAPKDGAADLDKPLSDMSPDELRAYVDRAQRELSDRAKPIIEVDSAPVGADTPTQVIDIFE